MLFASGKFPKRLNSFVKTRTPSTIRIPPMTGLKYFRCFTIFRITPVDCEKNAPVTKNGTPKPKEYARSELYAAPGEVAASVSVLPSIGPTHGVHPDANAAPNTKEVR